MAKYLFTTNGHFVNMDSITNMRIVGDPDRIDSIEVWFVGNTSKDAGMFLHGPTAKEFLDEFLLTHEVTGWPKSAKAE